MSRPPFERPIPEYGPRRYDVSNRLVRSIRYTFSAAYNFLRGVLDQHLSVPDSATWRQQMKLLFVFFTLYTTLGRLQTSNLTTYVRRWKLENNWPVLGQQGKEHDLNTRHLCEKRSFSENQWKRKQLYYVMATAVSCDPTEDVREYDDRTSRFRKNDYLDYSLKHAGKRTMCSDIINLCIFYAQHIYFSHSNDYLPKQD